MKDRPIGVTILAALAAVIAFLSAIHTLQFLGILPFFIGNVGVHTFNLWSGLMWALMTYIYIWLVQMLLRVESQAWIFLTIITMLNLVFDSFALIGSSTFQDVSVSFIVNGIILIYCLLPGTKEAFGIPTPEQLAKQKANTPAKS